MELFKEILLKILEKDDILCSSNPCRIAEIVETQCYVALKKIKAIIEDETLEDDECFRKIEEIICVLEKLGCDCGNRHDLG